uniref:Myotubularin related protein 9 n=1 Tax=Stegastes partitus TaxID=144197 RepID=A0A3B5BEH4_9TELE
MFLSLSLLPSQTDEWRLSEANKDFSVCPSYPPLVAVPKDVDDDTLRKVATFRHGGRFPVLSYYHKKNGMVMMRAGQPLTGTNGRRCKEDEKLINATLRPGKRGYIIDTRTINVAQQAKARGGGFESEANYPQWRRIHKALERSELSFSFIGLVQNDSSYQLETIKTERISSFLNFTLTLEQRRDLIVHQNHFILRVRVRNIFLLMVEHLSTDGHPFQQRCAQSAFSNNKARLEAPVFLLFLDCVWQILRQFPCSFEFSESFLVLLFEHAYASQFGTFLGNSAKTVSLWSWVNRPQELEHLTNPLYEANSLVIWPSVAPQSLLLWEGRYWNRLSVVLSVKPDQQVALLIWSLYKLQHRSAQTYRRENMHLCSRRV